jgi:pSer/pThr/pTyr-binding forkhead associated (FHA) protein
MRLVVKQDSRVVNEFTFAKGPIYIGRHTHSQIFLPERTVSRQHAVIYSTQDGKWMAEDLDSANKTYLNDEPIRKVEIKNGDILRITDFTIEIEIEAGSGADKPINLEDTLTKTAYGSDDTHTATLRDLQVIIRRLDAEHAPDIKLPAKRAKDFVYATEVICRANGLDEVLQVLLDTASRQFRSYHTWCALRNQTTGPMTCHAGKKRGGQTIQLSEIKLSEKITEAVEKGRFLLLPRIPTQTEEKEKIRSAMIAPIVGQAGCFGVLYVDNDMAHEHYTLGDLDYALLLAIHTSAILENF